MYNDQTCVSPQVSGERPLRLEGIRTAFHTARKAALVGVRQHVSLQHIMLKHNHTHKHVRYTHTHIMYLKDIFNT